MASKSKKRSKRRASINPLDLIRRNFDRGDFKQALKDTRVCYRQAATPELRSLLEHIYAARAQQLSRQGLYEDSRRIVQELLELGVTEPSVQAGLQELLLSVGMLDSLPPGADTLTDGKREGLQIKIADQAVLRPQNTPQSMPEVRRNAQTIRAALEAVERADEAGALTQLKAIPRQSLFADWKFFVRGLMSYYRRDKAAMLANWDRLDENRAAVKIAAPLKYMAGVASSQQDSRLALKVSRLEKQASSQPVLSALMKLQQFATNQDWQQVLRTLRNVGGELRKRDADVYQRVVGWLCASLIREEKVGEIERLARIAEPTPLDPHWHRARAMVRDSAGEWESHRYWIKYLDDLESVTVIPPAHRNLVRGMIHLHLARDHVEELDDLRGCRCGADHSTEIEDTEAKALGHLNRCLTLAPEYRPGILRVVEFHEEADRPQQAAETFQRWLERSPDDLDALLFLSNHYLNCSEPLKAREFAEQARKLKPLDKMIGDLLWSTYVKAARQFAARGEFDRARDELAAADRLQPDKKDDYDMLARRAALELKADQPAAVRVFLEEAQDVLAEPTALWLVMAIEATRFELPDKDTWLFEKRWQDALKRRCRAETAGLMCRMLTAHSLSPQPYESCDQHTQMLLKYVRRCSRVKWQFDDLRSVCDFLVVVQEFSLLEKFVKRGLRRFPQAAYLHWLVGKAEIAQGPMLCDRAKALEHLEQAIRLGTSSGDPRDKDVVDEAKQAQSFLNDHTAGGYDHDEDDDDFDGENGQFDDFLDELEGIPRDVILTLIRQFCGRTGVNPEAIMADLDRRMAARSGRGH